MKKTIFSIFIIFGLSVMAQAQFMNPIYNPPASPDSPMGYTSGGTGNNIGASRLYCYSHVTTTIYSIPTWTSAPTAETTLYSCTIPGGTLGANGKVLASYRTTITNSANTKTLKVKFGGQTLINQGLTTTVSNFDIAEIINRNSESSQVASLNKSPQYGTSGTAHAFLSVATTTDQALVITGQTSLETGSAITAGTGTNSVCTATLSGHGLNTGEYVQVASGSNCSTSGNPNGDPVMVTVLNANQFTYPCTCNGNMVSTFPTQKRYSVMQLESIDVQILKP